MLCVCAGVCVCVRERESKRERLLDALNVHVTAHVDVCVFCLCVCVRETDRRRQITNSIRCFVGVCKDH